MEKEKKSQQGIGFWGTDDQYGCFSNFYYTTFTWRDQKFCCSEQAFMWAKAVLFDDMDVAEQILEETNPLAIKRLGRKVKSYDDTIWAQKRENVMRSILLAKFSQNSRLFDILLGTGDEYIFEDSPYDYIWGVGARGTGENLLGKVLMDVRHELRTKGGE